MKKVQSGFTLIELVVVIVILGILGVTAIPRFIDLSAQAEQAAADGVAGALNSGMALNYAACLADPASGDCEAINQACDATEAGLVLSSATDISGYSFSGTATDSNTVGASGQCTITLTGSTPAITATYTSIDTDATSP